VRTVSSTAGAEARCCGAAAAAVMTGAGAVVCAGTARALLHAVAIKAATPINAPTASGRQRPIPRV
jgi:hypothetical protein